MNNIEVLKEALKEIEKEIERYEEGDEMALPQIQGLGRIITGLGESEWMKFHE